MQVTSQPRQCQAFVMIKKELKNHTYVRVCNNFSKNIETNLMRRVIL